jgi:hypothetical protein
MDPERDISAEWESEQLAIHRLHQADPTSAHLSLGPLKTQRYPIADFPELSLWLGSPWASPRLRLHLEQIQFLLGHASIQTTERYLGSRQNLKEAVNDRLGLDFDR